MAAKTASDMTDAEFIDAWEVMTEKMRVVFHGFRKEQKRRQDHGLPDDVDLDKKMDTLTKLMLGLDWHRQTKPIPIMRDFYDDNVDFCKRARAILIEAKYPRSSSACSLLI